MMPGLSGSAGRLPTGSRLLAKSQVDGLALAGSGCFSEEWPQNMMLKPEVQPSKLVCVCFYLFKVSWQK